MANRRMLQTLGALAQGDCDPESVLQDEILAPFLRELVHTLTSNPASAGGAGGGGPDGGSSES
jgi:hypothetical protein